MSDIEKLFMADHAGTEIRIRRLELLREMNKKMNLIVDEKNQKSSACVPIGQLCDVDSEGGNFEEISTVIRDTPAGEMRQCFYDVMKKRKYCEENIAAGRVYVSVFTDFIAFVNNLRSRVL